MGNILSKPLILISWMIGGLVGVVLAPFVLGYRVAWAMADAVLRQAGPFRTLRPLSLRVDIQEEHARRETERLTEIRDLIDSTSPIERLTEIRDAGRDWVNYLRIPANDSRDLLTEIRDALGRDGEETILGDIRAAVQDGTIESRIADKLDKILDAVCQVPDLLDGGASLASREEFKRGRLSDLTRVLVEVRDLLGRADNRAASNPR